MASTKKDSVSKEKQLRDELQSLFNGSMVSETVSSPDTGNDSPFSEPMTMERAEATMSSVPSIDINSVDATFKKQARGVIDSMYKLYYEVGVIDKPEYIERKKNIDAMNMSNMLFQLKMTKYVMSKVLDEINRGNMNPKLIENYCSLNNAMTELTKSQANYMIFLEESAKKAKIESLDYSKNKELLGNKKTKSIEQPIEDVSEIPEEPVEEDDEEEEKFFITADPIALMNEIEKTNITYEDVVNMRPDYIKERGDMSRLVDYSNKNDLVQEYDVDSTTIKQEQELGDDSDLLDMM